MGDRLSFLSNRRDLAKVYRNCVLRTMSDQNAGKLNLLMAELGDTRLVSSRWLRVHGYSNSLVARYASSGWLMSPARGVYIRKGGAYSGRAWFIACRSGRDYRCTLEAALHSACRGTSTTCVWAMPARSPCMGGAATGLARQAAVGAALRVSGQGAVRSAARVVHGWLDEPSCAFLRSIEDGRPDFDLIGLPHAAELPAVRRKLHNLAQRADAKRAADRSLMEETLARIVGVR